MQKHLKISNLSCLFTYHDLQIQFQYQKNDFRLINQCLILTVFCNFGVFLMDSKVTKMKLHQSIHIELKLFYANFQNGPILSTLIF